MERRDQRGIIPVRRVDRAAEPSVEPGGGITRVQPQDLSMEAQIRISDEIAEALPFPDDDPDEFFRRMMGRPDMKEILEALAR